MIRVWFNHWFSTSYRLIELMKQDEEEQMTCEAEKINIPNIALNKVIGKRVKWSFGPEEKVVSYIEIPKVIR